MSHDLDQLEAAPPQLVDIPEQRKSPKLYGTALARHTAPRRPIVPAVLRNRDERNQLTRWLAMHFGHVVAYHLTRTPKYLTKCVLRAPIGLGRLVVMVVGWVFDREGQPLRSGAVDRADADAYMRLSSQRNDRVKLRLSIVAAVTAAAVLAVGALVSLTGAFTHLVLAFVGLVVLAVVGSPRDKPLTDRAVVVPQAQKLTSDVVVRALSSLGIAGINQALAKDTRAVVFVAPITRDGPGWRADIDLPFGVTCTDVIERRARLAGGLTRPLGCVWPTGDAVVHPGRLVLWVGDEDMATSKQPAWPLRSHGTTDIFAPLPAATDQRGKWVSVLLMFCSVIIGAVPRMGKTFILRQLLLMAALDVRVQVHAYDLKGTGDLSPLAAVCHRYGVGDDPDDIDTALTDLRGLIIEMRRRAKVIRELPRELCPENKVTPELAGKRSLGLYPIVLGVDECQIWFEHPEHGKEFEALCTDLVKRGPALGIIVVLATQRPDAKSLPTSISANATTRICLKVQGQLENDMVLGTSMYKNGHRATTLGRADKGVAILAGEGDDPVITRWVNIDAPTAETIALRALAARRAAGTLTGHAAGEPPEPDHDLLADVLHVVNQADGERVWSEDVCTRLGVLRPGLYAGWQPEQLAAALKPYGVATGQIFRDGTNRRGVDRAHILAAIEARRTPSTDLAA